MSIIKKPWELAFLESSCMSAWRVTGYEPFTLQVYWELKEQEDTRQAQSEATQKSCCLNINNFTLNSIASTAKDAARAELRGYLQDELHFQSMDEQEQDQALNEVGNMLVEHRLGTLYSNELWDKEGGVTGQTAAKMVFDSWAKQQDARKAKADKAAATVEKDLQQRQDAAPLVVQLKAIVREHGW
eukprot:722647-Rhodomonas_salina.1